MSRYPHLIRRQCLELELPSGQDAYRLQERVTALFNRQLVPVLDAVMSRQVGETELLRIDRLELDLGVLDPEQLEEQLPERLRHRLEQALATEADRAVGVAPGEPEAVTARRDAPPVRLDLGQSELQRLIHYLATGLLPWWSPETPGFDLEVQFSRQLEQQRTALLQGMRRLPAGRVAARLSRQLGQPLLGRLVLLLAEETDPGAARVLEAVVALATEHAAEGAAAIFERLLCLLLQPAAPGRRETASWLIPALRQLVEAHALDPAALHARLAAQPGRDHPVVRHALQWLKEQAGGAVSAPAKLRAPPAPGAGRDVPPAGFPSTGGGPKPPAAGVAASPAALSGKGDAAAQGSMVDPPAGRADGVESPSAAARPATVPPEPAAKRERDDDAVSQERGGARDGDETERLIAREQGVYLRNTGLVLLWPYLPRFFQAIGLVADGGFIDRAARERALLMLQYLACGATAFQEHELLLNKLLCGWPLSEPVACRLAIRRCEREEADRLLDAVIANWKRLKKTSRDGLRKAFLQREGRLSRDEMGWQLKIHRMGMDILLESLPWGIGLIRLPWMKDAIRVEW